MRGAEVARVVGEHGGPSGYVRHALAREGDKGRRPPSHLLDQVAIFGLRDMAAGIVANALVDDTDAARDEVADVSLAYDHGHALLAGIEHRELADLIADALAEPVVAE